VPSEQHTTGHDIIVVGASAGGVKRDTLGGVDGCKLRIAARNRRRHDFDMHAASCRWSAATTRRGGMIMLMRPDGTDGA
jgi:hypothetical protein